MTFVQAVPPTFTVAPAAKPVPLMVRVVPPKMEPDVGEIEPIVGFM